MRLPSEKTTLQEVGEDRLVATLTRAIACRGDVQTGIGDDCAVVGNPRAKRWTLLKTDAVIEGIHFLPGEDPQRVGRKAICRALSDIAAMGGVPEYALITLAAAPAVELAHLQGLYRGLRSAARRFAVDIVGGETSRSPGPLFVSIALTGWVEPKRCVLRSGGTPGDLLYVTGRLGGSIGGKHLDFHPRLAEGRWLATRHLPSAMMDLSDGLGADLPRMATASRCGFTLHNDRVPCSPGADLQAALADGEDYELLFAINPALAGPMERAWAKQFPKLRLSQIGQLTPKTRSKTPAGFDHFK